MFLTPSLPLCSQRNFVVLRMYRVNARILRRLTGSTTQTLRPSCQGYHCQGHPSRVYYSALSSDDTFSNLPQQVDLLERYRGLVTAGIIQYDEEQLRVVMQVLAYISSRCRIAVMILCQLRRLQRELIDYAPPAICSNLIRPTVSNDSASTDDADSWWVHQESENLALADAKSLVRSRGYAEELSSMNTPKVKYKMHWSFCMLSLISLIGATSDGPTRLRKELSRRLVVLWHAHPLQSAKALQPAGPGNIPRCLGRNPATNVFAVFASSGRA